ncbi:hypothetical protein ERJ75_000690100 [Trypanosoma vivax]|nr:hypothetical protein ERJ75_000690100 [Trypanosoma vivax]
MQRLFCGCAFFLAAASVTALAQDPGPGTNAAEFAVLCGAYRAAKEVQASAEHVRAEIEKVAGVGTKATCTKKQVESARVRKMDRRAGWEGTQGRTAAGC